VAVLDELTLVLLLEELTDDDDDDDALTDLLEDANILAEAAITALAELDYELEELDYDALALEEADALAAAEADALADALAAALALAD
jgi:hypothetical protein